MSDLKPILGTQSFSCPHCSALAHQDWFSLYLNHLNDDQLPWAPKPDILDRIIADEDYDQNQKEEFLEFFRNRLRKRPFGLHTEQGRYLHTQLENCYVSKCFSCKAFSIWVFDELVFPSIRSLFHPAVDMPENIRPDFEEAARIFNLSPRGAAALLRLCVQKICVHLGGMGRDINSDIAKMVERGLSGQIQQALDIVRVVGNQAVHPGVLDLRDDRDTAGKLFKLVNLIVETQITQPKEISSMFENLPAGALDSIRKRDTH